MTLAENLWLGSTQARQNLLHVVNYSTAFYGSAAIQGWKLGVDAPVAFWAALARASGLPANAADAPAPPPEAADPIPDVAPMAGPVPEPAPEPASETAAPEPAGLEGPSPHLLDAPRGGRPDDLTLIAGIGAKLAATLNEFGVYHFDQIASLDAGGIDWLNEQQPGFKALETRFDLVGQARTLAG